MDLRLSSKATNFRKSAGVFKHSTSVSYITADERKNIPSAIFPTANKLLVRSTFYHQSQRRYFASSFYFPPLFPLAFPSHFPIIVLYVVRFIEPIFPLNSIRRFTSPAAFGGARVGDGGVAAVPGGKIRHRTGD